MSHRSWSFRVMARLLIVGQMALLSQDLLAATQDQRKKTPPSPPPVKVNRTLPKVEPVPARPLFSDPPTDTELFKARVFEEPLVPAGATSPAENKDLARAIERYQAGTSEDIQPFERFLASRPQSAWGVALLANLAIVARRTGHFSKTLRFGEQAWRAGRDAEDPRTRALAERGLAELAELEARLGRLEELKALLAELEGRSFSGAAGERLSQVRESASLLEHRPEASYRCGPLAIGNILLSLSGRRDVRIDTTPSTLRGTSLAQMEALAKSVGLGLEMGKREDVAAEIPTPAMVHWKVGHFGALVKRDKDRYLLQDPTFGDELWISREAIDQETDGYFLIPERALTSGWREVKAEEGGQVWGKGAPPSQNTNFQGPNAPKTGGNCPGGKCCPAPPMAVYQFNEMLASLVVTDAPVGYTPPVGPAVRFTLTYNQREAFQPAVFSYSNLGPMWTFDWIGYITDNPSSPGQTVTVYEQGGGQEVYTGYNSGTQSYAVHFDSRAVLKLVTWSPVTYERTLPDGTVETYAQADGSGASRKVFLTQVRDPQGNERNYTFDQNLRLVAVSDAIEQVTTLAYEHPTDPLKVTRVTDPFGRYAELEYDTSGHLFRITDIIGIQSQFTYQASFLTSLTTPYGTTHFVASQSGVGGLDRNIDATDPMGGRERLQYANGHTSFQPQLDPAATVPDGFASFNHLMDTAISVYWDKRAMASSPGDYTKAAMTHWLWMPGTNQTSAVARGRRLPQENRVWYAYAGQSQQYIGSDTRPIKVGRVLDDGTSQITTYEYNAIGKVIKATDPRGRETVFVYGTNNVADLPPAEGNGIDLLDVKQKNPASPGGYDLLQSYRDYSRHLPEKATDASGQLTGLTYNAYGQVLTIVTPPRASLTLAERTTTFSYDANGYAESVTGPVSGATVGFTYDGYGRVRTTTDADSYTVTFDYDAADRLTKATYPDGTKDETTYSKLDAALQKDRLGRVTQTFHDALRRPSAVRDAAGRVTTFQWCNCGSLDSLIDANNNKTTWVRDTQSRVTSEIRANSSHKDFVYENTTSRLKQVTDAKTQVIGYEYFNDDNLKQVTYTNEQGPTSDVSFTYDPSYDRLASMVDGTGTTDWAYNAVGQPPALGAARLQSIDGPLDLDVISYGYDELGRVASRSINGVAQSQIYDALGRMTSQTNALGAFTYSYQGATGRLASVGYPNGQATTFDYEANAGDHRLKEIWNKLSGGATLSKFNYTTDVVGNIKTWKQQVDSSAAKQYDFGYDAADQIIAAVLKTTDPTPTVLKRYGYDYDKAGNRTTEQIDDATTSSTHNNMNRLTSQQPGGALTISGTVNEAATVLVQGKPASVSAANVFEAKTPVVSGTNTITVQATDATGVNMRTNTYDVTQAGSPKTLTYDSNGNMTGHGTRIFTWDAENRLLSVTAGTHASEFTYDGLSRRVRIVEKDNGSTTSDKRFLWCGLSICEERDSSGANVTKRYFAQGVRETAGGGASFFYARDHLGSIRELVDSSNTLRARYDYDPWGRRTKTAGDKDADFGFTGHYEHAASGITLALYRAYDSELGRWISDDPIGLEGGLNLYGAVGNRPTTLTDRLGLFFPHFHYGITLAAGLAEGLSFAQADMLATQAAVIDLLPGSQADANSVDHALSRDNGPTTPGQFIGQVDAMVGFGDLPAALHAMQDLFAPAHKGFQKNPTTIAQKASHMVQDIVIVDPTAIPMAIGISRKFIKANRHLIPCPKK